MENKDIINQFDEILTYTNKEEDQRRGFFLNKLACQLFNAKLERR